MDSWKKTRGLDAIGLIEKEASAVGSARSALKAAPEPLGRSILLAPCFDAGPSVEFSGRTRLQKMMRA
jgi:hypothetical protein